MEGIKEIKIPIDLKTRTQPPTNTEIHIEILEIWKILVALSENQNKILTTIEDFLNKILDKRNR